MEGLQVGVSSSTGEAVEHGSRSCSDEVGIRVKYTASTETSRVVSTFHSSLAKYQRT